MAKPQQPELHRYPENDQDQPDLNAMAQRLGVAAEGDEPDGAPAVTATEPEEPYAITAIRKRRRALALAIAVPAAAAVVIRQIVRHRR